jgi:hypothetical protein
MLLLDFLKRVYCCVLNNFHLKKKAKRIKGFVKEFRISHPVNSMFGVVLGWSTLRLLDETISDVWEVRLRVVE